LLRWEADEVPRRESASKHIGAVDKNRDHRASRVSGSVGIKSEIKAIHAFTSKRTNRSDVARFWAEAAPVASRFAGWASVRECHPTVRKFGGASGFAQSYPSGHQRQAPTSLGVFPLFDAW
jgi:hypothetical protein